MSFADVLNDLMKEKGISQAMLAKHIGYSQRAVSKWVNRQSEPTENPIVLCAKFFGITTDEMLGYSLNSDGGNGNGEKTGLYKKSYSDEKKLMKIYSELSEKGKARIIAYSEFVSEEEKNQKR